MKGIASASGALLGARRWLSRTLVEPPWPLLALEVRPRALAAVRLISERGRLRLGAAACSDLPEGALEVSLTKPNVRDGEAFSSCVRAVLERVGALAGGPIALVLPDSAVRVAVLTPGVVRGRAREVKETVRFRLHKALPFDARSARLAWDRAGGEQTVVAIAPEEVLRGYEEPLEALGHQPGLVLTASVVLTQAISNDARGGDRLLVNWDEGYVSFVIVRAGAPLLVRTLPGEDGAAAVARHAASTLQFHRDRLAGQPLAEVVVRAAALGTEESLEVLTRATGLRPRLVAPWASLDDGDTSLAAQAVAGAAACLLRSAA